MNQITLPKRATVFGASVLVLLLLTGCFGQRNTQTGPQISDTFPEGWKPVVLNEGGLFSQDQQWVEINVDDDAAVEYLLFFTFDSDQIGAVIYDQAVYTTTTGILSVTPMPAPFQPTGAFIPYRIEPSYWEGSGQVGYIALPGTTPDKLVYSEVQRVAQEELEGNQDGVKELLVVGDEKVMTVIWWKNSYFGYGVTQVAAGYKLVRPQHYANDQTKQVLSIVGLDPLPYLLYGSELILPPTPQPTPQPNPLVRNIFCRQTLYNRAWVAEERPAPPPDPYGRSVQYIGNDEGIVFCDSPMPDYPFFPEGVALAFLRPEDYGNPEQSLADMNKYRSKFVHESAIDHLDDWLDLINFYDDPDTSTISTPIIHELLSPSSLSIPREGSSNTENSLKTDVCVMMLSPDKLSYRLLLLHMQYQPPTYAASAKSTDGATPAQVMVTDRMAITALEDKTAANKTCADLIK